MQMTSTRVEYFARLLDENCEDQLSSLHEQVLSKPNDITVSVVTMPKASSKHRTAATIAMRATQSTSGTKSNKFWKTEMFLFDQKEISWCVLKIKPAVISMSANQSNYNLLWNMFAR